MNKGQLLKNTEKFVKEKMSGEVTGHDWFHVDRVRKNAVYIAKVEKDADLFIVQLAALLHDIGDWKINTSHKSEKDILKEACNQLQFPLEVTEKVTDIILNMSFTKNISKKRALSKEGQIVQDADRLDALGAIGIARAFAYGGKKDREMHNPMHKPQSFTTTEEYKKRQTTTINHFYEKVFFLKELMNTKSAKKVASKREKFMKEYLDQFYREWKGMI